MTSYGLFLFKEKRKTFKAGIAAGQHSKGLCLSAEWKQEREEVAKVGFPEKARSGMS